MRLWHKALIPVLPRQQLLSQWRECCCIARNMNTKGTPNHILVNPIMDYSLSHFGTYTDLVIDEMKKRGYKINHIATDNYQYNLHMAAVRGIDFQEMGTIPYYRLFEGWHNDRYLTQCYYNLQEKYDRGGIPEEEWAKVAQMYNLRYTKKG